MLRSTHKPVRRITAAPLDHRGRHLVVQVGPGDVIQVWAQRCRQRYSVRVASLYEQLVWDATSDATPRLRLTARARKEG